MGSINFFTPQQPPISRFLNDALIYSKLLEISYGKKHQDIGAYYIFRIEKEIPTHLRFTNHN